MVFIDLKQAFQHYTELSGIQSQLKNGHRQSVTPIADVERGNGFNFDLPWRISTGWARHLRELKQGDPISHFNFVLDELMSWWQKIRKVLNPFWRKLPTSSKKEPSILIAENEEDAEPFLEETANFMKEGALDIILNKSV